MIRSMKLRGWGTWLAWFIYNNGAIFLKFQYLLSLRRKLWNFMWDWYSHQTGRQRITGNLCEWTRHFSGWKVAQQMLNVLLRGSILWRTGFPQANF